MPNDDVWVTDVQSTLISQFSPYPGQRRTRSPGRAWATGAAVSSRTPSGSASANGFLYASIEGEGGGCGFEEKSVIFDNYREFYKDNLALLQHA